MPEAVTLSERGRLAVLEFSNPPVNVLTMAVMDAIIDGVERAGRGSARGLLLTGAGKHFSAGSDVGEHLPGSVEKMLPGLTRAILALRRLEIPSVAWVHGATMGGALELALGCDFIVAAEDSKLSLPEITLGVFPPVAAALLPARMRPSAALELILSGEQVPVADALATGLVHKIGTREQAEALLERFAKHPRPALVAAKRAVRLSEEERLHRAERIYLDDLMKFPEPLEGIRAFLEKRAPAWK